MERKLFISLDDVLISEEFVEEIKRTSTLKYEDLVVETEKEKKTERKTDNFIKLKNTYEVACRLAKEELFKYLCSYIRTDKYYMYFNLLSHYEDLPRMGVSNVIQRYLEVQFTGLLLKGTYLTELTKELTYKVATMTTPKYNEDSWVFLNGILIDTGNELKFEPHSPRYFVFCIL